MSKLSSMNNHNPGWCNKVATLFPTVRVQTAPIQYRTHRRNPQATMPSDAFNHALIIYYHHRMNEMEWGWGYPDM